MSEPTPSEEISKKRPKRTKEVLIAILLIPASVAALSWWRTVRVGNINSSATAPSVARTPLFHPESPNDFGGFKRLISTIEGNEGLPSETWGEWTFEKGEFKGEKGNHKVKVNKDRHISFTVDEHERVVAIRCYARSGAKEQMGEGLFILKNLETFADDGEAFNTLFKLVTTTTPTMLDGAKMDSNTSKVSTGNFIITHIELGGDYSFNFIRK